MRTERTRKIFSAIIAAAMVSVSFGLFASDTSQAAFIQSLAPLPAGFTAYDTAWNEAGTMAVLAGHNSTGGANAFAYWPNNDTYTPITGGGSGQMLRAVDYFREPVQIDWQDSRTILNPINTDGQAGRYEGFPSMVMNSTGALFVSHKTSLDYDSFTPLHIARSIDGGNSFQYLTDIVQKQYMATGVSSLVLDVDDSIIATYTTYSNPYFRIFRKISLDSGATFSAENSVVYTTGIQMFSPNLLYQASGNQLCAVYVLQETNPYLISKTSSDLGATWGTSYIIVSGEKPMVPLMRHYNGKYFLFYQREVGTNTEVVLKTSTSSISGFSNERVFSSVPGLVRDQPMHSFQDAQGRIWLFYTTGEPGVSTTMWYTISEDVGLTWSDPKSVPFVGNKCYAPSIAYDSATGTIYMATVDYSGSWTYRLFTANILNQVEYRDVFWVAGDNTGPASVYTVRPDQGLQLNGMNDGTLAFNAIAVDDLGNPLCGGAPNDFVYYHDGKGWITLSSGNFDEFTITGIDFNPNDGRFYLLGQRSPWSTNIFYSDPVPFTAGVSQCHYFGGFGGLTGDIQAIAWNHLHDYGLVAEDTRLLKIWPYGHYANGTIRYQVLMEDATFNLAGVSWDTDGWNEAAIVGSKGANRAYWRFYHTSSQTFLGYEGGSGHFRTCAMKPPSSPKWLLIPYGGGSVRVNILMKDQSAEITIHVDFPHIFTTDMWRQDDPGRNSVLNTQVDADATYTFFIEGNYSKGGADGWDGLSVSLTAWYDHGNVGSFSPGDPLWTSDGFRTRQFNIGINPVTGLAVMGYPTPLAPAGEEFAIHSSWMESGLGPDGSHRRLYVNVSFGPQTWAAPGSGPMSPAGNIWDSNMALNDPFTWDFRVQLSDSAYPDAVNHSYEEFGIKKNVMLSASGNPAGNVPPGAPLTALATPSVLLYSSNTPYRLNVSIPHLYRNGNPASPDWIPVGNVWVQNVHTDAFGNSGIAVPNSFTGENQPLIVWGTAGAMAQPVGNGTVSAGPNYSDYTAAAVPEPFQHTTVDWYVEVVAGTPEGVYWAVITFTMHG